MSWAVPPITAIHDRQRPLPNDVATIFAPGANRVVERITLEAHRWGVAVNWRTVACVAVADAAKAHATINKPDDLRNVLLFMTPLSAYGPMLQMDRPLTTDGPRAAAAPGTATSGRSRGAR